TRNTCRKTTKYTVIVNSGFTRVHATPRYVPRDLTLMSLSARYLIRVRYASTRRNRSAMDGPVAPSNVAVAADGPSALTDRPSWSSARGHPWPRAGGPLILAESTCRKVRHAPHHRPDQLGPPVHARQRREQPQPAHEEVRPEPRPVVPGGVAAHHLQQIARAVVD